MSPQTYFTLRPQERNTSATALDGAFRVHLSSKELQSLASSSGDLMRLSTSEGPKGLAIAWLANQTDPGNKPIAKVTDLLREVYGLSLKDRVFIEKAKLEATPTEYIAVTLLEGQTPKISTKELLYLVRLALGEGELDMVFPGYTFGIQRQGLRNVQQAHARWRLRVEVVAPIPDINTFPLFDPVNTNVEIIADPGFVHTGGVFQLDDFEIGGLSHQILTINKLLRLRMNPVYLKDRKQLGASAFLLHGPEGTGKSMLLGRLSECPWRRVYQGQDLYYGTKNPEKDLKKMFESALSTQPSLIVFDDLDKLLTKFDNISRALETELRGIEGSRVVIAATARSVLDIDTRLRTAWAFKHIIELFPPTQLQRKEIISAMLGTRRVSGLDFQALAERTYGYVGGDLYNLCSSARSHRLDSLLDTYEDEDDETVREALEREDFLTMHDFDSVFDDSTPSALKNSIVEVPKVKWADIAGLEDVQTEIEAMMIRPLKRPDLYSLFGVDLSRKGMLLYGPPGCAKTMIAQAVATECDLNFLAVKGSELIQMYVGESERGIRDVFRRARAAKPCIIFFDEIDSIGKSREKSQDSGLNVVTTLLNEMDGIETLKEVYIIGATNRPDILDSALIRPGRFDVHIHIGLPTKEARKKIFELYTRNNPLAQNVDLNALASKSDGNSGAEIKGICSAAANMAISDYAQALEDQKSEVVAVVRMEHYERALEQHVPHTLEEEAARYASWTPGMSLSAM